MYNRLKTITYIYCNPILYLRIIGHQAALVGNTSPYRFETRYLKIGNAYYIRLSSNPCYWMLDSRTFYGNPSELVIIRLAKVK